MLSGRKRWKTTISLISKKATLMCTCSTLVLYISFPLFCTTSTWNFQKLLSYTFYGENVVLVLVHSFPLPLIFTLHWSPPAFVILSPSLQNFHVVLPTKNVSFVFYLSALNLCRPFPRWPSLASRTTFSFSLSFSCSIFQICGHDSLTKLNTLDNTDTETISAFRFRLCWLFCCLCFTRRRWLCEFPPK